MSSVPEVDQSSTWRGEYDGDLALPRSIACKISSESVGYVTMSAVRRVDLPLGELISKILGVCGKDPDRVESILARGSLVSGEIRYRWVPVAASSDDLAPLLARFPDHEPDRVFEPSNCVRMVLRGDRGEFEITREAGRQKRLFRRKAFWEEAMAIIEPLKPRSERYSYSEGADIYSVHLAAGGLNRMRQLGSLLRFTLLETQVRSLQAPQVMLYVRRD